MGPSALPSGTSQAAIAPLSRGFKTLHLFTGNPDGARPGGVQLAGSTLYGTTSAGGDDYGTVFESTLSGKEHAIYSFQGGSDGIAPNGGLAVVKSTFYGTTYYGGSNSTCTYGTGCGVVYAVAADGKERVLHRFLASDKTDGEHPDTPLVSIGANLYGATFTNYGKQCDGYGCGTVFEVTTEGKEHVIYHFKGGKDGCWPAALLAFKGTLYGATQSGGSGCSFNTGGTIFSLTTAGKEAVLYRFEGPPDGESPNSLILAGNTLYGTTVNGGNTGCLLGYERTCGIVFSMDLSGEESILYLFTGGKDGANPSGVVWDGGSLYGTTTNGGYDRSGSSGYGTIFTLGISGSEKVLYRFSKSDGANPGSLAASKSMLYGVATSGGKGGSNCGQSGCGTLFELSAP